MEQLRGKMIFAVEDNTLNRTVFQIALVMQGARVEFERWGKDAVYRLRQMRDVDLIILDLMLHNGISGYDIFTHIRELPEYAHTPIVAVSAAEPSIAIPKAKGLGFSGFISKPIDEELFPYQLVRIMDGEKLWHDGSFATL
jgi:two-component system, NarL family, sensor histidine kinase BarA